MKNAIKVIFWVFSIILAIMALALLSGSALSCALLLACAVLINPLFHEKVQIKKGLTAVLAIGLFIASVAVFPVHEDAAAGADSIDLETRQAVTEPEAATEQEPIKNASLQLLDDDAAVSKQNIETAEPTAEQKPTPTMKPTPTATIEPTLSPKPTPTSAPITRATGITILDYSETARRGSFAFIEIQGLPNTDYTCEVEYKSGPSSADGLGTKRSDASGVVSWRWKVGTRTSLSYIPTIYIQGGGDSISVDFEVTE